VDRAVGTPVEVGLSIDDARGLLRGCRRVEVRDGRAAAPEILMVDEPTNYLDLDSIEAGTGVKLTGLRAMGGGTLIYCAAMAAGFKPLGLHPIAVGITASLVLFLAGSWWERSRET